MRDLLKSRSFKMLLIAVFVVLAIMLYSASTSGQQNFITAVTSFLTAPVQKISALLSGNINDFGDSFTDIETIKAENDLLKMKARELTAQVVDYEELKQDNARLRSLLELKEENKDFQFLDAAVISRDTTDTYGSFVIDRGSMHGVSLLDPVITEDGLVGFVSQLGPISSRVTTILSPATDVGAIDRRTLDGGVLGGDLELAKNGRTKLGYLQRDCDVTAGDIIVTSGLGGIYPKNLIIGEVAEIKAEAQDISLYAIITPSANVTECTDVFVITYFDGQGAVVEGELAEDGTLTLPSLTSDSDAEQTE
ncbi:MAG: rod shape-determining protein MreC [Ruminococcaceae bacterium]|nr:rod shape-determining protein MreC [Oscillospiraceae bacterium]